MPTDFPRVLFLSPCAFNTVTGTGVTFGNLFRGWPREHLATITDDRVPVGRDVCASYYFLTDRELHYVAPIGWLRARTGSQQPDAGRQTTASVRTGWRRLAKRLLGMGGIPERGRLSDSLRAWLDKFRPELIYSILGTPGYFDLLEAIHDYTRAPFVVHVMDHGIIEPPWDGLFGRLLRRCCARRIPRLMSRAAGCLAIGEDMAEEYAARFGRPFDHFQNTIELDRWRRLRKGDPTCGQPARLLYLGSIFPYAVLVSLRDCCRAVAELNRNGFPVRLEIFTPRAMFGHLANELCLDPSISLADIPADDEAFFARLQQADALLLPANFDPASVQYIRFSMPTKVPSYLASGVPILVYGPPGIAQVHYASRHRWGHVIDQRSAPRLQQGIREILIDRALREDVASRAILTAERFHDAPIVRRRFQQTLIETATTAVRETTVIEAA